MELEDLLKKFREYSTEDTAKLEYAWQFSKDAHTDQKRASGEVYFIHCAAVAEIPDDEKDRFKANFKRNLEIPFGLPSFPWQSDY